MTRLSVLGGDGIKEGGGGESCKDLNSFFLIFPLKEVYLGMLDPWALLIMLLPPINTDLKINHNADSKHELTEKLTDSPRHLLIWLRLPILTPILSYWLIVRPHLDRIDPLYTILSPLNYITFLLKKKSILTFEKYDTVSIHDITHLIEDSMSIVQVTTLFLTQFLWLLLWLQMDLM